MVEKDGKLYGCGACDMECFLAVGLALLPTFLSMKRVKPVHIVFSYEEELGCAGIPTLIKYLKERKFRGDVCLVGDGALSVGIGNKGHCLWKAEVHGKAIHSSMTLMNTSCNATEYEAHITAKVREIGIDVCDNGSRGASYSCPFSPTSTSWTSGRNAANTVLAD